MEDNGSDYEMLLERVAARTGCDDWNVLRKPIRCRDCDIHFLRSKKFRIPSLAVKVFHEDPEGRRKLRKLRTTHERSEHFHKHSTAEFSVPEPVMMMKLRRALAMEYIDAPMASAVLRSSFFSTSRKDDVIRKSARWLAWFHSHAEPAVEAFEATRYKSRLASTVEKLHRMSPGSLEGDPFLGRCLALADKVAEGMQGEAIHHAAVHGDFTPFNLFIQQDKVIGFDYQENGRLPVSHDICRFLLYLDFTSILPPSAWELRKHGCRLRNFEIFMESYGADRSLKDSRHWLAFHFLEVVRRILSLTVLQQRGRKRPLRHIEMASLHRSAKHMMKTLS